MGFCKNQRDEQNEQGFDYLNNKYVCANCFEDYALKKFIRENVESNKCHYCNKESNANISVNINKVMEIIVDGIKREWGNPYNSVGWEEGWVGVDVIDKLDLINDLIETDNEDLKSDIIESINQDEWCKNDPYWLEEHEELFINWQEFSNIVKHKTRYVFYKVKKKKELYDTFSLIKEPYLILDEIGKIVNKVSLIEKIPKGSIYYRTRVHESDKCLKTVEELGPPKKENAKYSNRMSPAGISMFYGSMEEGTSIKEMYYKINDKKKSYTIAQFKTLKDIYVLNLTTLPSIPSLFDFDKKTSRPAIRFLYDFIDDFIKPVDDDDKEHIEYVPTQIVTEYFRFIFKHKKNNINGIIYPSARQENGKSCVIFADGSNCIQNDTKNNNKKNAILCLIVESIKTKINGKSD